MPSEYARHIKAIDLARIRPTSTCCDCRKEVADATPVEIWTIWHTTVVYCQRCAEHQNIGPAN